MLPTSLAMLLLAPPPPRSMSVSARSRSDGSEVVLLFCALRQILWYTRPGGAPGDAALGGCGTARRLGLCERLFLRSELEEPDPLSACNIAVTPSMIAGWIRNGGGAVYRCHTTEVFQGGASCGAGPVLKVDEYLCSDGTGRSVVLMLHQYTILH